MTAGASSRASNARGDFQADRLPLLNQASRRSEAEIPAELPKLKADRNSVRIRSESRQTRIESMMATRHLFRGNKMKKLNAIMTGSINGPVRTVWFACFGVKNSASRPLQGPSKPLSNAACFFDE
jgi:hypothetical protein